MIRHNALNTITQTNLNVPILLNWKKLEIINPKQASIELLL
jgi:hypothetical protein